MKPSVTVPIERLREYVAYDPDTGSFTALIARPHVAVGKVLGHKPTSSLQYSCITLDGKRLLSHRAAWALMTGEWPDFEVDHEDRNKLNNRWCNLRAAPNGDNYRNRPLYRNNTSGKCGVSRLKNGRYSAMIQGEGKQLYIGTFPTIEAAANARREYEQKLGFHPNHGRSI